MQVRAVFEAAAEVQNEIVKKKPRRTAMIRRHRSARP